MPAREKGPPDQIKPKQLGNREIDAHELTLATTADGLSLYALTFVSCLAEQ